MRRIVLFLMPLIFGIISIAFGVMTGITSHQVTYQQGTKGVIAHFLAAQTTAYLQMQGSPTLYIIHEQDFTPQINGVQTFTDGETVSFTYTTSETTPINVTSKIGTHLVGTADTIVAITAYDPNQPTHALQIFMTAQYSKHLQGYYVNNWILGGGLLAAGFALCGISLLFMRPKKQAALNIQDQPSLAPEEMLFSQDTRLPYTMPSSSTSGTYPPFPQQGFVSQPAIAEQAATPSAPHQFFPQRAFQLPTQPQAQPQASHVQMGQPSQPVQGRRSLLSYASQPGPQSMPQTQAPQSLYPIAEQTSATAQEQHAQLSFPNYPQLPFPPYVAPEEHDITKTQQYPNPPSQQ